MKRTGGLAKQTALGSFSENAEVRKASGFCHHVTCPRRRPFEDRSNGPPRCWLFAVTRMYIASAGVLRSAARPKSSTVAALPRLT